MSKTIVIYAKNKVSHEIPAAKINAKTMFNSLLTNYNNKIYFNLPIRIRDIAV